MKKDQSDRIVEALKSRNDRHGFSHNESQIATYGATDASSIGTCSASTSVTVLPAQGTAVLR